MKKGLSAATRRLLKDTGARVPIVKGPMYPGSNPELVAAVSEAGGFGVVQPISLTKLYGHDFREGLRLIKSLTSQPFGVNLTIVENARYKRQMEEWMDIAIDEGVKFFLTSLGKPDRVVRKAEPHGTSGRAAVDKKPWRWCSISRRANAAGGSAKRLPVLAGRARRLARRAFDNAPLCSVSLVSPLTYRREGLPRRA